MSANQGTDPNARAIAIPPSSGLAAGNYTEAVEYVESALTEYFKESGLPFEGICVSIEQRLAVARNQQVEIEVDMGHLGPVDIVSANDAHRSL